MLGFLGCSSPITGPFQVAEGGSRGGQGDELSEDFNLLLVALKTKEVYHRQGRPLLLYPGKGPWTLVPKEPPEDMKPYNHVGLSSVGLLADV